MDPPAADLELLFAPPRIVHERRADGSMLLSSTEALEAHPPSMAHLFRANADANPGRLLAAERDGEGWRELTWGEARVIADALAQALLDRGLGPDRPLMILSGNSLDHLLMLLASCTAGIPVLPISGAYSLMSRDHQRVRAIAELCRPGLVFAAEAGPFGPGLDALRAGGAATGDRVRGARRRRTSRRAGGDCAGRARRAARAPAH